MITKMDAYGKTAFDFDNTSHIQYAAPKNATGVSHF